MTWLQAGESEIAATLSEGWPTGARVRWMVPGSGVHLRPLAGGALPEAVNCLRISVSSVLPLGEECRVTAQLPGLDEPLHLPVPLRLAEELTLGKGAVIEAILRESQIHILPP